MYDIGRSKRATRAYSLDDIALIPSRRTRGTEMVNLEWRIDALTFDFPIMAAPMDSVMSPATAIEFGRLGGLGVLNLEGLWTRYEDPTPYLEELAGLSDDVATTRRMQEIYSEPIKAELITARMTEIRAAGVPVAGSLSPKNASRFSETVVNTGADFFVIRGTTVSAEHVGSGDDVLDLRKFIYETALHLMRTGAAGVLVGFGGGAAHTTRQVLGIEVSMASAIADVAEARRDYMDESGGRYVHVIADGSVGHSGDIAKAIACGADAVMVGSPLARAAEAPGRGWHWGAEAWHADLPRGSRVHFEPVGTLAEVLSGPSRVPDGTMNLVGGLRQAMATTGYSAVKEFQRIELTIR